MGLSPPAPAPVVADRKPGSFVYDLTHGQSVFCSAEFAAMHGLDVDGCKQLPADERVRRWIHPDDQTAYRDEVGTAQQEQRAYAVTYRLVRADGEIRTIQESAEPWLDEESGSLRHIGFALDVTGQVRARDELVLAKTELERRVAERTAELRAAKDEAEVAEREARAAHERFFAAAEGLADGLAIYDESDHLLYFNQRYPALAPPGFRRAMAIGRRFQDIVREAIRDGGMYHPDMGHDFVARRLAHRESPSEDQEFRIADGRWMRVRENALPDGGRVLLVHDISEQRAAILELEEREERLRALADGIPLPVIIARIHQPEILFINAHASRVFGLRLGPQREAIKHVYVDPTARHRLVERLFAEGAVEGFEAELRRADGSTMWAMLYARTIPVAGEVAMLTAVSDISERKTAQDQLAEREDQFRSIAEGVPLSLVIARPYPPEVLYLNERAEQTFALKVGTRDAEVIAVYADPAEREDVIRRLAAGERIDNREVRLHRRDGNVMWGLLSARFVTYRGEPAMLTTVTDISERKLAEEALRASEARLRAFVAHSPVGMYLKNAEGRYELVPDRLLDASGRTADQVLGRTVGELFGPPYAEVVEAHDREILERGEATSHEEYVPRSPGDHGWSLVIRFPIRDAAGAITHIGGFHVEIDERRAMEQALRESEARLAAFMANAPIGMFLKDLEGRYLLANPEMSRFFQTDAAAMIGRTFAECPAAANADLIDGLDQEVRETGRVVINEFRAGTTERPAWDLVIRFPLRNGAGEITAIAGFDVDITERKQVEQQLRESEQRFRVLAEAHPVPLVIVGVDDAEVIVASPACETFFGVELADLIGHSILRFYVDPSDREIIMRRMRAEGRLSGYEVRMQRSDRHPFWAAFDSRLITFAGKLAVVAAYVDLTEKKQAEAELEQQREALMQSEKMSVLGSLLASVAHELNNPLSVVVGQAAMLEELSQDGAMANRAGKIRAAAERCARIVRTFLAMARSKPPELREVVLNDLVRSALELTAYGLRSTGTRVELDLDPGLPPLPADGDQLHQVLTNLIINAKQAMQAVERERRLTLRSRVDPNAGQAIIEVEDTGPGVPAEARERIFDPFYTTKPQGVGTGIGLSVCRRIVTAHGGSIELAGSDGDGARFIVRLPFSRTLPDRGEHEERPRQAAAASARVLVVDDEPDIADVLAEILRLDGFTVDTASGGRGALELLDDATYELVISDLRMPDMDGPTLFRTLERTRPEVARRMLFVTGDTLSPDASAFVEASGVPVIEKPFDAQKIRRIAAEQIARLRSA
jgi:PAS domain S-box-containing protein